MEHFSLISWGSGLDFEMQRLGKHLGVHSTLGENTRVSNKAPPPPPPSSQDVLSYMFSKPRSCTLESPAPSSAVLFQQLGTFSWHVRTPDKRKPHYNFWFITDIWESNLLWKTGCTLESAGSHLLQQGVRQIGYHLIYQGSLWQTITHLPCLISSQCLFL